jgi:hypothetical protein
MDILKLAQDAGMEVVLDGRIGREEYRSVYGTIQALQRFADALRASVADETDPPGARAEITEKLGNCEA